MNRIYAVTISVLLAMALCACSGSSQETTQESESTATTEVETTAEVTTAETTTEKSSDEIMEEATMVMTTETEAESLEDEKKADFDYISWFEEIKSGQVKGGDGSISDDSKVGVALYSLSDGESVEDMMFSASVIDYSPVRAQGAVEASITGGQILKTDGDSSSADDSSFYGKNAAVQSLDGAILTITGAEVRAEAENATGVFAYNGGVVCIADSIVNVSGGGAGGIQVAGGGELYASNLKVTSESKAAIRSDRGGGILQVVGGEYISNGSNGCPAVYSTADITVTDAILTSNHSRAVIIEGKNTVTLADCDTYGHDESTKEGSVKANVLLYQSASGDASEGTSVFTMNGGTMTAGAGAMFYCTNTSSVVNLKAAELINSEDGGLLIVSAGRWGKDGSNGGNCTFNAEDQTLEGDIIVDSISTLELNMTSSEFTGVINSDGVAGEVTVTMDNTSTWKLTADSYISEFNGNVDNVETGSYHLYVNGEQVK